MSTALATTNPNTAIIPASIADAMEVAKQLAASTLVPDAYKGKPTNCYMAIQYGSEIGLTPVASLMSICVIKGKPSLYAASMVGLVMASGKALYFDCIEATTKTATYETHRIGSAKPRRFTFTYEDAKRAELLGGMYSKWPQRMLDARAKAFLCKDVYPDVLLGLQSYEEIIDIEPANAVEVSKFAAPAEQGPAELPAASGLETEQSSETSPPETEQPSAEANAVDQIIECKTMDELRALLPELGPMPKGPERDKALALYSAQEKTIKSAESKATA